MGRDENGATLKSRCGRTQSPVPDSDEVSRGVSTSNEDGSVVFGISTLRCSPIAQCGSRTPRLRCDSNRSQQARGAPPLRGASKGNSPQMVGCRARWQASGFRRRNSFGFGGGLFGGQALSAQSRQATQHRAAAQQDDGYCNAATQRPDVARAFLAIAGFQALPLMLSKLADATV